MEFFFNPKKKPYLPGKDITLIDTVQGEPLLREVRQKYWGRTFGSDFGNDFAGDVHRPTNSLGGPGGPRGRRSFSGTSSHSYEFRPPSIKEENIPLKKAA